MRILRPSANPDEYTRRVSLALPGLTIRAYLLRGYRGRGSDRQSNRTNGQALRVSFRTSHPFVRRRLSLAQQLLYDKEESRQVTIWRDWCERKCRRFFNHFPVFFAYKSQHLDFMHELFIWGDSHYTALGNEIFARDLIAQYR